MSVWSKIAYLLLLALMCFFVYRTLRANPQWLTKESLSKSFGTMGILALILIVVVALLALLAR